jgi:hypothetical protein
MEEKKSSSMSKADSDKKIGSFWDDPDLTELDTDAPDSEFEVISKVPVEPELLKEIERQADKRGVKVETLVDQWLRRKLDEEAD